MSIPINDHLKNYLKERSAARFLQLRDAVARSPSYAPYASRLDPAHQLLDQGKFDEARQHLLSLLPNWLLNPGIHQLLSFVHHKLGEDRRAQFERAMAQAMLRGILSTGDGSAARPYLVLRTADEYDVLRHLGKRSRQQALVQEGERRYDRQDCDDGSEIWFDVTVQLAHLGAQRTQSR
jgi:predicted Zn-dependent protease